MRLQSRQLSALLYKDLLLLFGGRNAWSTVTRAFLAPLIVACYLTITFRIYYPKAVYGVGTPSAVRTLDDALDYARPGSSLVFLNNASSPGNGEIDRVIQKVISPLGIQRRPVILANSTNHLRSLCRPSLRGVTKCFAAVVFQSSPSTGGTWSYTLRGDAPLGLTNLDVRQSTNDGEIRIYPLQHAIDSAINSLDPSKTSILPRQVNKYLFTSKSEEQWQNSMRKTLLRSNINFASVVWIVAMIGVTFHLVTLTAREREGEMTDLIEAMMPNIRRWEPQAIRILARHLSFDLTYGPSWILLSIFLHGGFYKESNFAIPLISLIIAGLALVSFSILGAAFFKRAQLSSISVVGLVIVLAIIAQVTSKDSSTATVAITGLLFTPMALVNFLIFCARHQIHFKPIEMMTPAPESPWTVTGIIFWMFFLIQIIVYPLLAVVVERHLFGTAASRTQRTFGEEVDDSPIIVENVSKVYKHTYIWSKILELSGNSIEPVYAVRDLSLRAIRGSVTTLVGGNGCGKTTMLNAIVGLGSVSTGSITVDGSRGIGICPQKNVLWDSLSVRQHAKIFNRLKTPDDESVEADLDRLFLSCGLTEKLANPSHSLSGGQKRKLQLLMMLTGGSQVCCVDEASGGLDPLSRRKVWDVLLSSRGSRTIILTTHFLDEAELLADQMIIMAKGQIKASGSVSELKMTLGGGYRVQVLRGSERTQSGQPETFEELETVASPADALARVRELERQGITNYQIAGPTMEEVFMKMAADPDAAYREVDEDASVQETLAQSRGWDDKEIQVPDHSQGGQVVQAEIKRRRVGAGRQMAILMHKRWTIFQRNPAPLIQALLFPIVAGGFISLLLSGIVNPGCDLGSQFSNANLATLTQKVRPNLLVGPRQRLFDPRYLSLIADSLPRNLPSSGMAKSTSLLDSVRIVENFAEFQTWTQNNFSTINPGGIYLGDASTPPTFNVRSNVGPTAIFSGVFLQNALNMLLTGTQIITNYATFDFALPSTTSETLQFTFYFGLVMAAYPAFFTLYVNLEKTQGVRAMEYSNGVRPLPLWSAYTLFDFFITFLSGTIVTIIFAAVRSSAWYFIGYFWIVAILYGLASVLLAYIMARYSKSQFSAFALAAGGQCLMLLAYMTIFMTIQIRTDPALTTRNTKIVYYCFGLISPVVHLVKAMLVGLNLFSVLCDGEPPIKTRSVAGLDYYGGPILFLTFQCVLMFWFLVWADHGYSLRGFKGIRNLPMRDTEVSRPVEPEVLAEEKRVGDADDGLKVMHVSKVYRLGRRRRVHAVDDLTFGVKKGEIFALVGVNGAGKSTTISMLRGETEPSGEDGDLFVQGISVLHDRYSARFHLGVCPQFDAMDRMSVREHVAFYARIRGVVDVDGTVNALINNVGLQPFTDRMAESLSGGNKRKVSLAMALVGNPEVVLLDEPSCGMDPLAKRNMWKTLAKFRPGRSILLTTHSMEEADALASRVGVIQKRLLEIGTTKHLRSKHGYGFHVHLVLASAPRSTDEEMAQVQNWLETNLLGTRLEGLAYHGQMRFIVPASASVRMNAYDPVLDDGRSQKWPFQPRQSVTSLFALMEERRARLGVEFYSVSPATFDEIFLKIIEKHNPEDTA